MNPVTEALLRWYDENAREMPWRGIRDPYGIWVSEVMLQQTRVDTVRDYYPRFMERFPTLKDLAGAGEEEVLKMWEGLGYYSRARNLQAGARQVMEEYGGRMPETPAELRKIRGIGPYTSCSVASIAFGVPVPAVDGNVIRVICRLYNLAGDPTEAGNRAEIEALARELVPEDRAGDHNQAVMDLGATVCVPGTPGCDRCPLREMCEGRRAGTAERLPNLPGKKPPREIEYDVVILRSGGRVLLRRREEKMLRGLWCFPMTEGHRSPEKLADDWRRKMGVRPQKFLFVRAARHVFTHQVWQMSLYTAELPADAPEVPGYVWIPEREVAALPFPTAMKAALETLGRVQEKEN